MTLEQFKQKYSQELYLGDGLYVHFDGYHFWLRAPREDGEHEVALDPLVFDSLIKYRENVYQDAKKINKGIL